MWESCYSTVTQRVPADEEPSFRLCLPERTLAYRNLAVTEVVPPSLPIVIVTVTGFDVAGITGFADAANR